MEAETLISDPLLLALILLLVMFFLLLSSLWIGASLMLTGLVGMLIYQHNLPPALSIYDKIGNLLAGSFYDTLNSWSLAALPMFILMGEILYRSKVSSRLFNGLMPFLNRVPGKLLHINVVACSLFAAISGSSAATTATVGKITLHELKKRNYDKSLAIGSLAGSGTLGFLIPPSLIMIIYGVLANVSIGKLFIAGILPGLLLALSYSIYIMLRSSLNKDLVPGKLEQYSFKQKLVAAKELLPVLALIFVVLGSIYGGFATPTEAAALGVLGSVLLAALFRSLSLSVIKQALLSAIITTGMISFIIASAGFLAQVIAFLGIARALSQLVVTLELSPLSLILVVGLMYLVLGMILDGISIVVMTLPIVLPIITLAGYDPLWFGIFLVFMVEISQITPPVGFSLFVLQGISGESIGAILRASFPFFLIMILTIMIITFFPQIVFYLPHKMIGP